MTRTTIDGNPQVWVNDQRGASTKSRRLSSFCKAAAMSLALVAVAFSGLAEQVSSDMVARAVNTMIAQEGQMECPISGVVSSVRLCTATNGAAFYVVKLSGGGFVVTSTDTEIDPIIAISAESDIAEDPENPLWALLVGDMADRQKGLAAKISPKSRLLSAVSGTSSTSEAAARWTRLIESGDSVQSAGMGKGGHRVLGASTNKRSSISDVRVAPLLKTKWGQSNVGGKPCYNYYTPKHYVCGCTATAAAQIFRYHKFPTDAVKPRTYGCYVEFGKDRELTQKGGVYDWDNMPYTPGSTTSDKQRKAIGKLTYDVGVAIHSQYTKSGTGASLGFVGDLCYAWGYAHASLCYDEDSFTRDQIKSVLVPNLDAKLPVQVTIRGPRIGHSIVADGYGYWDGLFCAHLNFGWEGSSDAWYVLPSKINGGGDTYTRVSEMLCNIYPEGPSSGGIVSGRVLSASTSKPVAGIVVKARNSEGLVWQAVTDARGIYAFILPDKEDPAYFGQESVQKEDDEEEDDEDDYDDYEGYCPSFYPSGNNWPDYEDDEYEEEEFDWKIYLENASPTAGNVSSMYYLLFSKRSGGYYDRNFSVNVYTVKFDPNGGTGGVVSRNCNVVGTLPTTKRTGYTFEGWFTARNGGAPVTESTLPTGNVTYYAHWKANTYMVAFDSCGGSGSMDPMSLTYDVAREIPLNAFAKAGTSFRGWSLSPRRLVSFADGETVVNLAAEQDGVVTLYAFWDDDVVAADMGEYFKATLFELGYDVPTDGKTAYSVVAKGLPAGLKLKYNAAVKDKKGKVTKPAKVEWWIEGVPTAALDFFTNPPYLVITVDGVTTTEPLPMEVVAQDVVLLDDLALGQSLNVKGWLAGVGAGWSVTGLPTGLSFATKKVTKKSGSKTVTVAEAYSVYGKTAKAGLFTITAKKKVGAYYETKKFRVLVRPAAVMDTTRFGYDLVDMTTMAYVPVEWDLANGGEWDGGHAGRVPLPAVSAVGGKVAKMAGLPAGLTFAAADTYAYANPKKKTGKYLKQKGQTIVGTPKKPGTYAVTFTKNVTTGTGKNKKTVAKTAQILWKVVENDAELSLGFNDQRGGVIEGGTVGLKYGDLMAFTATEGATVTASGLPAGIHLVDLGEGNYAFAGFTTKAGTYLVTVTASLNGKSVTQRVALKVDALPAWAKGTYNGYVKCKMENGELATNGLATVTVSAAGKISGKFQEFGTNWTLSAACYTNFDGVAYSVPVTANYSWKVKRGKKTETQSLTRTFHLAVSPVPIVSDVPDVPIRGAVQMVEAGEAAAEIEAWQDLWGSTYRAVGQKLFYTSKKKPYRTFTQTVDVDGQDCTLSLKVTTAGAVTATLTYDTGKTKKDPKTKKTVPVYYKPTCSTVVIPFSLADAAEFAGGAWVYFAPSPGNGFPDVAGWVPLP